MTVAQKPKSNAVVVPQTTLSSAELMAALRQSGMVSEQTSTFRRMKLDGGMLVALDAQGEVEEMFPPKIVKGEPQPSVILRIVEPPVYYNAIWLGPEFDDKGNPTKAFDPNKIGRPDLNKTFAKKYDDAGRQAADKSPGNEAYDQIVAASGNRGEFRGDLQVQIVPESGEMTGEETIYTLSLSASACLDWRGTRRDPEGGVVQDKNFIVQLGELAVEQAIAAGVTDTGGLQMAVLNAMTALRLGGVVAEVYLLRATSEDGNRTWTIPAFKPVHIESVDAPAALADPTTVGPEQNSEDIGF